MVGNFAGQSASDECLESLLSLWNTLGGQPMKEISMDSTPLKVVNIGHVMLWPHVVPLPHLACNGLAFGHLQNRSKLGKSMQGHIAATNQSKRGQGYRPRQLEAPLIRIFNSKRNNKVPSKYANVCIVGWLLLLYGVFAFIEPSQHLFQRAFGFRLGGG